MCSRCDALAAENAGLKDELAEWQRQGRENASVVVTSEVRDRWAKALGVTPRLASAAILLAERQGRLVPTETVAAASCVDFDALAAPDLSAKVCVHKLRRAMTRIGVNGRIETVWGEGYRLPVQAAEALRRVVGT